jgi:hypothetical protein
VTVTIIVDPMTIMMIVKTIDDRHRGDHRMMMIVKLLVRQDICPAAAVAARRRRPVQRRGSGRLGLRPSSASARPGRSVYMFRRRGVK